MRHLCILGFDVGCHLFCRSHSFSCDLCHLTCIFCPCSVRGDCFLKRIPYVLGCVIDVRVRANLSGNIVVTDNMISRDVVLLHQVLCQLDRGCHGRVLKVPVLGSVCLTALVVDTELDADRVAVPALCVLVALGSTVPCNILILNALPYLALKAYKIVGGCSEVLGSIIVAVRPRASKSPHIVDDDILDAPHVVRICEVIRCEKFLNLWCCHRPHSPLRRIPYHPDSCCCGMP